MVARYASLALLAAGLVLAQPQPPGPPLACGGGVTVLLNGAPLSAGCVLNIKAGTGIIATPAANPAIGGTDLSFSYNTALIPTHDTIHANENFCDSTNGTVFYTCNLPNKALVALARGNVFLLAADTACASGCSLRIDGVGQSPITIKQADGVTDPNGLLVAGQARWVWFDGKIFRLL